MFIFSIGYILFSPKNLQNYFNIVIQIHVNLIILYKLEIFKILIGMFRWTSLFKPLGLVASKVIPSMGYRMNQMFVVE